MNRTRPALLALALVGLLAACAPAARTTEVRPAALPPLTAAEHYHPHEPGTSLTYVDAEGNQYELETLAPRLLSGTAHQHQQYVGPGVTRSTYRRDTPQGLLLSRVDDQAGTTTYDPPMLELPPAGRLEVGLRWGGEPTERQYATGAALEPSITAELSYLVEVTDRRNVRIGNERVTAFLISTEEYRRVGESTSRAAHERWYAPYYGDITNRESHDLVQLRSP